MNFSIYRKKFTRPTSVRIKEKFHNSHRIAKNARIIVKFTHRAERTDDTVKMSKPVCVRMTTYLQD